MPQVQHLDSCLSTWPVSFCLSPEITPYLFPWLDLGGCHPLRPGWSLEALENLPDQRGCHPGPLILSPTPPDPRQPQAAEQLSLGLGDLDPEGLGWTLEPGSGVGRLQRI